jgi:hypothetical protein
MAEMVERVDGIRKEKKEEVGIENQEEDEEKQEKVVDERTEEKMEEKGMVEKGTETETGMGMVRRQVIEDEPQYHRPRMDSIGGIICMVRTEMGKSLSMSIMCTAVEEVVEVSLFLNFFVM